MQQSRLAKIHTSSLILLHCHASPSRVFLCTTAVHNSKCVGKGATNVSCKPSLPYRESTVLPTVTGPDQANEDVVANYACVSIHHLSKQTFNFSIHLHCHTSEFLKGKSICTICILPEWLFPRLSVSEIQAVFSSSSVDRRFLCPVRRRAKNKPPPLKLGKITRRNMK